MNAVARFVQADPRHPHRVVGPGGQDQFRFQLSRLGGFGEHVRVKSVVRVRGDGGDPQLERAVAEAMKQLRQHPPRKVKRPPYPKRPGV